MSHGIIVIRRHFLLRTENSRFWMSLGKIAVSSAVRKALSFHCGMPLSCQLFVAKELLVARSFVLFASRILVWQEQLPVLSVPTFVSGQTAKKNKMFRTVTLVAGSHFCRLVFLSLVCL